MLSSTVQWSAQGLQPIAHMCHSQTHEHSNTTPPQSVSAFPVFASEVDAPLCGCTSLPMFLFHLILLSSLQVVPTLNMWKWINDLQKCYLSNSNGLRQHVYLTSCLSSHVGHLIHLASISHYTQFTTQTKPNQTSDWAIRFLILYKYVSQIMHVFFLLLEKSRQLTSKGENVLQREDRYDGCWGKTNLTVFPSVPVATNTTYLSFCAWLP